MVASFGRKGGSGREKLLRCVNTPKGYQGGKGPIQLTWMQMWTDLLTEGVDRNKIDKQPNAVFLKLWR